MGMFRTLLVIAIAYYAIRFFRRLWTVANQPSSEKEGKINVQKKSETKSQNLNFNNTDVEDVDFEEVKD
jgi:hypothetical protein